MTDELAKLKEQYARLNLLYQVSNVIHSTLDSQEALELIVGEALRLMRAASGSLVLINPTTGFLEILASRGLPASAADLRLRVGEGMHHIEVKKEGHWPYTTYIDPHGARAVLDVRLRSMGTGTPERGAP